MDYQEFQEFSRHCPFLSSLKETSVHEIFPVAREQNLAPGEYLMREGEPGDSIYLIVDGIFVVVKGDAATETEHVISRVKKGDTVGELAFLDFGPRSASVRAFTDARVLQISFEDLRRVAKQNNEGSLELELVKKVTEKLRFTNDFVVDSLIEEIKGHTTREHMGRFFIGILVGLSCFIYCLPLLKYLMKISKNSTYVTIPVTLFFIAFTLIFMVSTKLPLATFGITLNHWKKAVFEGVLWSIPVAGGVVLLKLWAIHYDPLYFGHPLFEPYLILGERSFKYWLLFNFIYWLIIPLQELVTRGALQSLLQEFLIGKHKVLSSVLISNLLFGIGHLMMSEQIGIIVFFVGLYMGFLYATTRNLIGPIVAHIIIGTWALSVIGAIF